MKVKRQKKLRKTLQYYHQHYRLRPPYKVVVDTEFVQAALEGRIQLKEQLSKMLQMENGIGAVQRRNHSHGAQDTEVCVTRCIVHSCERRGNMYGGALFIARKLKFLSCRHKEKHLTEHECIKRLIANGNPDHLILGLNNKELRRELRVEDGVPLMYIRENVPVMEQPSQRNKELLVSKAMETLQKPASTAEEQLIKQAQEEAAAAETAKLPPPRPRKRVKQAQLTPPSSEKTHRSDTTPSSKREPRQPTKVPVQSQSSKPAEAAQAVSLAVASSSSGTAELPTKQSDAADSLAIPAPSAADAADATPLSVSTAEHHKRKRKRRHGTKKQTTSDAVLDEQDPAVFAPTHADDDAT